MQIEAIYDSGKLEFSEPIKFTRNRFKVIVDLPDEAIVAELSPQNAGASALPDLKGSKMLDQIRQITGPLQRKRPPASVEEDKLAFSEALAEKYSR
jgi:hypothetical protein